MDFLSLLHEKEILLFDGALGTELMRKGLKPGETPDKWNIDHPEVVREVFEHYYSAGSDMVQTATFRANGVALEKYGIENLLEEIASQKTLTKLALYPVASVPFVRDVASGVLSDYGYNSSPVTSMLEQGISGTKGMAGAFLEGEAPTKSEIKRTSKLAAAAAGVPGVNQAWASG